MSKAVIAKPSSADICNQNGWVAGTVLEGDEGWGMERIVITAVGEHRVLARRESHTSWAEGLWDLHHRVWRKVEPAPKCSMCNGDGYSRKPRIVDEPCEECNGTGKAADVQADDKGKNE